MDDIKKMLRAVINGQSVSKQEVLGEIKKVRNELLEHKKETKEGIEKLNSRLDKIGKSVAFLEDDTPTREEFDKLDGRVGDLEQRFVAI